MKSMDCDITPINRYRLGNRDVFYVPNFLSVSDMFVVPIQLTRFSGNLLGRRGAVYPA